MNDKNPNMLEIKNLSVEYRGVCPPVVAVDDISLKLAEGESLGIIGESGCGKSSLALAVMNLLKDAEISGEIIYNGVNLPGLSQGEMRSYRWREIAIVFQNSLEVLNPVLRIEEQIKETMKYQSGLSPGDSERRFLELLNTVGLDLKWRGSYPHELSGGMRQRVLIAMALSCEPKLLIVDEPTTALDPISKEEIISLLLRLQAERKLTMIVITHDIGAASRLTKKIVTMYCGRIVEAGPSLELLRSPLHCYTRGLLNSSPNLFKYKDLWGITGEVPVGNREDGCVFFPRCCQRDESCRKKRPPLNIMADGRMVACHKGGIETFLEASDITKTYKSGSLEVDAVKNAAMRIRSGEVVALVGESGSGKSTFAHCLAGVFKADSGEILFRKNPVRGNSATSIPEGMQIIFQDPFSATSHRLKVIEVVREPLDIMKWKSPAEREEKAVEAIKTVQLPYSPDFLNRYCYALSGGQRQRLAIARALVTDPVLLIADEVTSMLDPSTQANLLRKLKELQNSRGFAMLYITHDLHLARKIADKVYVMYKGEIVESGAAFQVLDDPKHDYSRKLLGEAFLSLV